MRLMIGIAVLLSLMFISPGANANESGQAQIEVSVDLIRVPVTVTDDNGRHIAGLQPTDFELLEDGLPQKLQAFDETVNALTAVMLLDTSGSMAGELPIVQDAANEFIRQMREGDALKLMEFNTFVKTLQDFTSDKAALQSAIKSLQVTGATTLLNGMYEALQSIGVRKRQDEERRTAVILLSDGDDTASFATSDMVTTLAKRTQVPIYAVRLIEPERRPLALNSSMPIDRDSPGALLLKRLANETGGRFAFARPNQLKKFYSEVADELHNQYRLGYISSNRTLDGKWRNNTIRVKGRNNLRLRYRPGYYATATRRG